MKSSNKNPSDKFKNSISTDDSEEFFDALSESNSIRLAKTCESDEIRARKKKTEIDDFSTSSDDELKLIEMKINQIESFQKSLTTPSSHSFEDASKAAANKALRDELMEIRAENEAHSTKIKFNVEQAQLNTDEELISNSNSLHKNFSLENDLLMSKYFKQFSLNSSDNNKTNSLSEKEKAAQPVEVVSSEPAEAIRISNVSISDHAKNSNVRSVMQKLQYLIGKKNQPVQ